MISINSLHKGMNLRDSDIAIEPGYTKESIGVDFSVLGSIRPMRSDLPIDTYATDIQDARIEYVQQTKYVFTTHSDGLYVYDGVSKTRIDSSFTGTFRSLVINDQYVVFANETLGRKWKPGWAQTYQWGLNTPPKPTLAAGAQSTKTIDDFESITGWGSTGGGAGGAISLDASRFKTGSGSMKVKCDASNTILVTKSGLTLDLSKYSVAGDLALSFIEFWYYAEDLSALTEIKIQFSCDPAGSFDSDFYSATISFDGNVSASQAYTPGGLIPVETPQQSLPYVTDLDGSLVRVVYDPATKQLKGYPLYSDDQPVGNNMQPPAFFVLNTSTQNRTVAAGSGKWTSAKFAMSDFIRNGSGSGMDWSTITAIRISLTASSIQAVVSFDDLALTGGGYLWGSYWVAVAYQNELANYGPYSDFAGPIYLEGQPLSIAGLTVDSDSQTKQRRLAIIGGAMTAPMVSYVNDNTSTSYVYNQADSSLTLEETLFYNKPPAGCLDMIEDGGRIWMVGISAYPNNLRYSETGFYEAFPERNYLDMGGGEELRQVSAIGQNIAVRGKRGEHLVYLLGSDPLSWKVVPGAKNGCLSSRFMVKLDESADVYAGNGNFYMSSGSGKSGIYLPLIGSAVSDFSQVFGSQAGELVYLYFKDKSGIDRLMRWDFRLGHPVAHYVGNLAPSAVFSDPATKDHYYALGQSIYQLEGASGARPINLTIPQQYARSRKEKDFSYITYDLSGNSISFQVVPDGVPNSTIYSMPTGKDDPVSLPVGSARSLGMVLLSSGQDFTLVLPIVIEEVDIG